MTRGNLDGWRFASRPTSAGSNEIDLSAQLAAGVDLLDIETARAPSRPRRRVSACVAVTPLCEGSAG